MIPRRRPDQSHEGHQQEMADWLGCTVDEMNADHDRLHAALAVWLGFPSMVLRVARGEDADHTLANHEENAALYLQRYLCALRNSGYKPRQGNFASS